VPFSQEVRDKEGVKLDTRSLCKGCASFLRQIVLVLVSSKLTTFKAEGGTFD
jgi:hypothetical protein